MKEINSGVAVFLMDRDGKGMRGIVTSKTALTAVIGCCRARAGILYNVLIPATNTVITDIPETDIQEACDMVYKVGDQVRSKLGGGFTGEVTGFELETNRIVCRPSSDRPSASNDRVRYAYAMDEIEAIPDEYRFYLNRKYKINGQIDVRVVESPCPNEKYLLIREDNGTILFRLEEDAVYWDNLRANGIKNIQPKR